MATLSTPACRGGDASEGPPQHGNIASPGDFSMLGKEGGGGRAQRAWGRAQRAGAARSAVGVEAQGAAQKGNK